MSNPILIKQVNISTEVQNNAITLNNILYLGFYIPTTSNTFANKLNNTSSFSLTFAGDNNTYNYIIGKEELLEFNFGKTEEDKISSITIGLTNFPQDGIITYKQLYSAAN